MIFTKKIDEADVVMEAGRFSAGEVIALFFLSEMTDGDCKVYRTYYPERVKVKENVTCLWNDDSARRRIRNNGVPYGIAGLIFERYAKESNLDPILSERIDRRIMQYLDVVEFGIMVDRTRTPKEFGLKSILEDFNLTFKEKVKFSDENYSLESVENAALEEAVEVFQRIYLNFVEHENVLIE